VTSVSGAGAPIIEFDHHSSEIANKWDEVLERVTRHRVFYTESYGGFWVVASNEVAKGVLRDPATFSTERIADGSGGITIPQLPVRLIPAEVDPPYHSELRKVINPLFNRTAVGALQPIIERVATEVIDAVLAKGEFDVVHDIAHVFPARVMLTYLGFAESDRLPLMNAVQTGFSTSEDGGSAEVDTEAAMALFAEIYQRIMGLVEQRRAQPLDDVVSHLVTQTDYVLNDEELLWVIFTLVVGGTENVGALLENALLYLHDDDRARQRLIEHPEEMPGAVEEFLRHFTPGVSTVRHVRRDVELDGLALRPGDRVLVWLPGPNHDPALFDDPRRIDISRSNAGRHMAFGEGTHHCPGAIIGRLEVTHFLTEFLRRVPGYRIEGASARRFTNPSIMNGWWSMPARTRG
jgi:cytochrome P450